MIISQCPVCAMDAADSSICSQHIGIVYHFCMPQCRENFLLHPNLYIGKNSPTQRGRKIIKRRTFTLDQVMSGLQRDGLMMAAHQLMSAHNISIEANTISIDYNLLELNAHQIESALIQAGASMGSGWSERLKRGWIHYSEENELDHLAAPDAACCNQAPGKG
ncbi:MAG: hypothetical protein JKY87_08425 [Mariprofundus sp.]|nr:hypothetical protein [Mariprofundus sp.]